MSFRSGHVDVTRSLKILRINDDEPVTAVAATSSLPSRRRMLKTIPSGVEKEEERELHLVKVLSEKWRLQKSETSSIPVPEFRKCPDVQADVYAKDYVAPKEPIQEEPTTWSQEHVDTYDADCEDVEWLNSKFGEPITLELFESLITKLEATRQQPPTKLIEQVQNDKILCHFYGGQQIFREFVQALFLYWQSKRARLGRPLIPLVRLGTYLTTKEDDDPYTVFRRRGQQMQTRKRGHYNEEIYEKLLTVRRSLNTPEFLFRALRVREYLKSEKFLSRKEINKLRYERATLILRNTNIDKNSPVFLKLVKSLTDEISASHKAATSQGPRQIKQRKQTSKPPSEKNGVLRKLSKSRQLKKLSTTMQQVLKTKKRKPTVDFSFTPKPQCRYQIEPKASPVLTNNLFHPTTLILDDQKQIYLGIIRRRLDSLGRICIDRYTGHPDERIGPNVEIRSAGQQDRVENIRLAQASSTIIRAENNGDRSYLYIKSDE